MDKIIRVHLHPGAKKVEVNEGPEKWEVYVRAPATEGKANAALIDLLSEHLGCPKTRIILIKGKTSRLKTLKILGQT